MWWTGKGRQYDPRNRLQNLLIIGSIPLRAPTPLPQDPHTHFYQFNILRAPTNPFSSKPKSPYSRHPLTNAPKGSSPSYRTFLLRIKPRLNSHSHGCCCSRFGYSLSRIDPPLPRTARGGHVCSSLWTDCACQQLWLERPTMRTRRGQRSAAPGGKGTCS